MIDIDNLKNSRTNKLGQSSSRITLRQSTQIRRCDAGKHSSWALGSHVDTSHRLQHQTKHSKYNEYRLEPRFCPCSSPCAPTRGLRNAKLSTSFLAKLKAASGLTRDTSKGNEIMYILMLH